MFIIFYFINNIILKFEPTFSSLTMGFYCNLSCVMIFQKDVP
jgi:hypothetical protein